MWADTTTKNDGVYGEQDALYSEAQLHSKQC